MQAPPTPLSLHAMLTGESGDSLKSQAQKMLHSYPDNMWALAIMASQTAQTVIGEGYRSKTKLLGNAQLYSVAQQCLHETHYVFFVAVDRELALLSGSGSSSPGARAKRKVWINALQK